MADREPSPKRYKASTLAQRVEVCKLIDPNKNGSRKLKVKVALVAAGLKSPDDGGTEASTVSKWLRKWRRGDLQQVSAVSTQLRGVPLQYPLIDEYVLRLVHARAEAVGSLGFGNNSLTLRAKAEEYAKKLTLDGREKYDNFQASRG